MDPAAQRSWQPILQGDEAVQARRIVAELAAALAPPPSLARCSLDGAAGRALFFAYLVEDTDDDGARALVDEQLNRAVSELAESASVATLWGGFLGVAWIAQHVSGRFRAPDDEDDNDDVDALLGERLQQTPWTGEYNLISGLCGYGVYGLERINRAVGRELVAQVVARLDERSERAGDGITWLTRPEHVAGWARPRYPRGYYNCGVAHGVPAIVTVLAGACAAGIAVERARPLYDGAVRWLLKQRSDGTMLYPSWIADGQRAPARLGWCYGDAGIAAALLAAGQAVGDGALVEAALALGQRTAEIGRDLAAAAQHQVVDAGLCHGAGGLAIVFHRLWSASGDAVFADAARWWYRQVLAGHRANVGIGGYRSWHSPGDDDRYVWADDDSLLTGALGVGLTLLAGAGSVEPAWDRLLAASLAAD